MPFGYLCSSGINNTSEYYVIMFSKITIVLMLTAGGLVLPTPSTATTLFTGGEQPAIAQTTNNDTVRVDAGGGNATAPLTVYIPQNITIEAGQTINWINPTTVGEPHSVTFLRESSHIFD
jgi:plastocyanin